MRRALYSAHMFESHFQSFDETSDRRESAARIAALRAELARLELDGFVVPRADRHQGEYVPAERGTLGLAYRLSTDRPATAIVLEDGRRRFSSMGATPSPYIDQVDTGNHHAGARSREERPEAWLRPTLWNEDAEQAAGSATIPGWRPRNRSRELKRAVRGRVGGHELMRRRLEPRSIRSWGADRPEPPPWGNGDPTPGPKAGRRGGGEAQDRAGGGFDSIVCRPPKRTRCSSPIRMPWRGCSTSAAPTSNAYAAAARPSPFVPSGRSSDPCSSVRAKLGEREHAALWRSSPRSPSPGSVETVLAAIGKTGKTVLFDAATVHRSRLSAGPRRRRRKRTRSARTRSP